MKQITITDDTFHRHMADSDRPVLLVFKASFCGPSAMIDPFLDQIIEDYGDDIILAEVDVENCPKVTRELQVKGTPSFIVMNLGVPLGSRIGTSTYEELAGWLDKHLAT
jgi:thioredoxin 1